MDGCGDAPLAAHVVEHRNYPADAAQHDCRSRISVTLINSKVPRRIDVVKGGEVPRLWVAAVQGDRHLEAGRRICKFVGDGLRRQDKGAVYHGDGLGGRVNDEGFHLRRWEGAQHGRQILGHQIIVRIRSGGRDDGGVTVWVGVGVGQRRAHKGRVRRQSSGGFGGVGLFDGRGEAFATERVGQQLRRRGRCDMVHVHELGGSIDGDSRYTGKWFKDGCNSGNFACAADPFHVKDGAGGSGAGSGGHGTPTVKLDRGHESVLGKALGQIGCRRERRVKVDQDLLDRGVDQDLADAGNRFQNAPNGGDFRRAANAGTSKGRAHRLGDGLGRLASLAAKGDVAVVAPDWGGGRQQPRRRRG